MRNSSLVEKTCAENVTGLKHDTEATDFLLSKDGRGASCKDEAKVRAMVDETGERMPE